MPQTNTSSKYQNRYEYQKKLVACPCTQCNGALVPAYTVRNHSRKHVKTTPPEEGETITFAELLRRRKKDNNALSQQHTDTPENAASVHQEVLPTCHPAGSHVIQTAPLPAAQMLHDDPSSLARPHVSIQEPCSGPSRLLDEPEDHPTLPAPDAPDQQDPLAHLNDIDPPLLPHNAIVPPDPQDNPEPHPDPSQPDREPSSVHRPATSIIAEATSTACWSIIMLMAAWLHHKYSTPWRAIAMMLQILRLILISLHVISPSDDAPCTLSTTFKRLGLHDRLEIRAMCPACRRVYPVNLQLTSMCTHCGLPLFKALNGDGLLLSSSAHGTQRSPVPILQTPFIRPSKLIADVINSTSTMESDLDRWRTHATTPGILERIQDGNVWRTLPGPDGDPFFDNTPNRPHQDELRIGVIIGFDGFGFKRSAYAGKHSTGVLSMSIANLDTNLRYRVENLILCGLTPGPHELTAEELQHLMDEFVSDLLDLYRNGITVKTLLHPDGRLVRVVIVCQSCDHPALCRMSGFADHSCNTCFCTQCHIPRAKLSTQDGLSIGAFPPRSGEAHRNHAEAYQQLSTSSERDEFFQAHAARYYAMSRLPYFDAVRMSVIDPMHNILLGVIKTQWYDTWIVTRTLRERTSTKKVPRELDQVHDYLAQFEMPAWVGRLPRDVGYPAGGSLTSDEWKAMALVYLPLIIPLVWEDSCKAADQEYQKRLASWHKSEEKRQHRIAKGKHRADGKPEPPEPKPQLRMHPQDADNFLSLAAALKILLARSIDDYLDGFFKLHPSHIKPNFHFITHIFTQIEDFGPVYGFWTFLFERLNKILKNYAVNNHDGGELEVTFMREFDRERRLRCMVNELASLPAKATPEQHLVAEAACIMASSGADSRGTVASLAQESAEFADQMSVRWAFGPGARVAMNILQQAQWLAYYQARFPDAGIISTFKDDLEPGETFLNTQVTSHQYMILDGRRIATSDFSGKAPNSIVQINLAGARYVACGTHMAASPELEIMFWKYRTYLDPSQEGPPALIPQDDEEESDMNTQQLPKIWATVGLTRDAIVL
ncbi:hypothetical protein CERSUDRAFT_75776 [Gelatoporia subvermispora B]|uniref:C2H2-type domain-containing protein n=1 Tax=Ceriporiopsis subvermispora (strain B) TaxID=914234 RepID=M2R874_CERS8|nr:hypothetical protein CERSUDRAFT_75776 [Gelatoporia subvermispora B]